MEDEGTTLVPVTISPAIVSRSALREWLSLRETSGGESPGTESSGTETSGTGSSGTEAVEPETRAHHPDHFIKLTEDGGERALYIGVGAAEAIALSLTQSGQEFPRPMTYQFAASLLAGSGSGLRAVRVTRLTDGVFYAQAVLTNDTVVDARPSDAINLAAITGAPVLVAAELLDLPCPEATAN